MPFFVPIMILNCAFSATDATPEIPLDTPILAPNQVEQEMGEFIKKRVPSLSLPDTPAAWKRQSDTLREQMLAEVVFRGVPEAWVNWNTPPVWGETLETGKGYRIRKLRYEALPGLWIPALLYEPDEIDGKVPAILNVNGHVGPPGKSIGYEQLRCINLAKQGMLALHPEWLVFGELEGADYKHNRLAYLDLCGVSGLAVFYLAMRGGLDVLVDYPDTDPERVAMTGLSGGGWQTIILSALDTRITLAVPNAGYIDLHNRVAHRSDIGDLEQNPTDLVTITDYTHLTAMLAPRPTLLIYNERDDCCFVAERAKPAVFDPIIPFYRLFDREVDFEYYMNTQPGTHNYDRDNREQFYRFVQQHFHPITESSDGNRPPSAVQEPFADDELFTRDELNVGIPEGNADFFTLAREHLQSLPKHRPPENTAELETWRENARNRLRDVLRLKSMWAGGEVVRQETIGDLDVTSYKLITDAGWTLPAVVASKGNPKGTILAFSDEGRTEIEEWIAEQVEAGYRVITVDLLLMGECLPEKIPAGQSSMMLATVGERPLGIQVGQLIAVIEWTCQQYEISQISLYSKGGTAGIVALAAAGLSPNQIEAVVATDALSSLKQLIEDHLDYEQHPALFCFGLLEEFDVAELVVLCPPGTVQRFSIED